MVTNVASQQLEDDSQGIDCTLHNHRNPLVAHTPQKHCDGLPYFDTPPTCTQRNRCKDAWGCQTCHNIRIRKFKDRTHPKLAKLQKDGYRLLKVTLKLIPPTEGVLPAWDDRMKYLYNVVAELFRKRSLKRRSHRPSDLGLIEYVLVYPHFCNSDGKFNPHFHGIVAVPNECDYETLSNWLHAREVELSPPSVEQVISIGNWLAYMTGEFYQPKGQSDGGVAKLECGVFPYVRRRKLYRETSSKRKRSKGRQEQLEDHRWYQIDSCASALTAPACLDDLFSFDEHRMGRLRQLATLVEAAHVVSGGGQFTLPTRRLATLIHTSPSQVLKDLYELESIGLIEKVGKEYLWLVR
jgi:hypothetical protein